MRAFLKSLLLTTALFTGMKMDGVDYKKERNRIADFKIAYTAMASVQSYQYSMAYRIKSQNDIDDYTKAHRKGFRNPVIQRVPFDKDEYEDDGYEIINLQHIIQDTKDHKASHIFLSPEDKPDQGYILSLRDAEFLQETHAELHQKIGVEEEHPLYIQYSHLRNAHVRDKRKTILRTGYLMNTREALEFILGHEVSHYLYPEWMRNKYKQAIEKFCDSKSVSVTSKQGAFLAFGRNHASLHKKNNPSDVLDSFYAEASSVTSSSSHPSDLERLHSIDQQYPDCRP